jgi:hypothetical protein
MHVQTVRPAGAGHEALWVLLAALAIVLAAALLIGVRVQPAAAAALAPHQIDARGELNAAEQGVLADLLVAAEEILALADSERALPPLQRLRELDLPPFDTGLEGAARGGHEWRQLQRGPHLAYVGRSAAPAVAASFLLRLPLPAAGDHAGHEGHEASADVWLRREAAAAWPEQFDDASLVRQGWRQVVTRYDAGVTRQGGAH